MNPILELIDEHFKEVIVNILKNLKENIAYCWLDRKLK